MKKRLLFIIVVSTMIVTCFLLQCCKNYTPPEDFSSVSDSEMAAMNYGQVFESVKYHILHDDKEWMAKHVEYPFYMDFPLKCIVSKTEFIQQYNKLFDRDFKKRLKVIPVSDIDADGYYSDYFEDEDKGLVLQLSDAGISWMEYDTKDIVKERNRIFADIRNIIDSEGEPIGCYISEDSTFAMILEKFYEDNWGEYGRAHVYRKYNRICREDVGEVYHGRLTYQGASSYPCFSMVDEYGNSCIYLEGDKAGNITTLGFTMSDWMNVGDEPSTIDRHEGVLKSIYFYQLLELWNK